VTGDGWLPRSSCARARGGGGRVPLPLLDPTGQPSRPHCSDLTTSRFLPCPSSGPSRPRPLHRATLHRLTRPLLPPQPSASTPPASRAGRAKSPTAPLAPAYLLATAAAAAAVPPAAAATAAAATAAAPTSTATAAATAAGCPSGSTSAIPLPALCQGDRRHRQLQDARHPPKVRRPKRMGRR